MASDALSSSIPPIASLPLRELPRPRLRANSVRCGEATQVTCETHRVTVKNGNDSQDICRVLNGMWHTSGGWGRIDRDDAVEAMLRYADAGLSTFDMADHYGPAEDLYGIFINRVRQERPPEYLEKVRGWDLKQEGKIKTVALTNEIPVVSNQMVDAWRGWSLFQALLQTLKGIATKYGVSIANVAVKYVLDQEDRSSIKEVTKKGKNLLQVIGDCGDEYRRR
ncbi:unnamed protein product [Malus baccata var. baccata]